MANILLLVMALTALSFAAAEEPAASEPIVYTATLPEGESKPCEQFVLNLFGLEMTTASRAAASLSADARVYYDFLHECILEVAAGTRTSAEFTINRSFELDFDVFCQIIDVLLAEHPYELFWFDKACGGFGLSCSYDSGAFSFCVLPEYARNGDCYEVDPTAIGAARESVAKSQAILNKYAAADDYGKLVGYMNEICELTEYNFDAVDSMYTDTTGYNNAWALAGCSTGIRPPMWSARAMRRPSITCAAKPVLQAM